MLSPKRVKHRKQHRGRVPGNAKGGTRVEFGEYGLKASTAAGSPTASSRPLESP